MLALRLLNMHCCIVVTAAGMASQDKNFDEESNASLSTARDETRDGFFLEDCEPSGLHMLRERTFSFSFWPKVGYCILVYVILLVYVMFYIRNRDQCHVCFRL